MNKVVLDWYNKKYKLRRPSVFMQEFKGTSARGHSLVDAKLYGEIMYDGLIFNPRLHRSWLVVNYLRDLLSGREEYTINIRYINNLLIKLAELEEKDKENNINDDNIEMFDLFNTFYTIDMFRYIYIELLGKLMCKIEKSHDLAMNYLTDLFSYGEIPNLELDIEDTSTEFLTDIKLIRYSLGKSDLTYNEVLDIMRACPFNLGSNLYINNTTSNIVKRILGNTYRRAGAWFSYKYVYHNYEQFGMNNYLKASMESPYDIKAKVILDHQLKRVLTEFDYNKIDYSVYPFQKRKSTWYKGEDTSSKTDFMGFFGDSVKTTESYVNEEVTELDDNSKFICLMKEFIASVDILDSNLKPSEIELLRKIKKLI